MRTDNTQDFELTKNNLTATPTMKSMYMKQDSLQLPGLKVWGVSLRWSWTFKDAF